MGGICGFVSLKGLPEQEICRRNLETMAGIIAYRGPTGSGYFYDDHAALGYRDPGPAGCDNNRQPFADEKGVLSLVYDGNIYNFRQLHCELQTQGRRSRARTDGQVIMTLYEEYGKKLLERLRGAFSLALWDAHARRLLLARDRFGQKPLYYTVQGDTLIFASEAKAVLAHPAVTTRLNLKALPHYFTFQYFPGPESAFQGLHRLRPACSLTFDATGTTLRQYWRLNFRPDPRPQALNAYITRADYLLRESMRLHLTGNTPAGCFLSGGVDSGTIAALFGRIETGPPRTFSVGCAGGKYDELPLARETARLLGATHQEITIEAEEFWENLPQILWHQDEPVADPAAAALYFAARLAAAEVRVMLSGEGADEIFGGYDIYREPAAVAPLQYLPDPAKKLAALFHRRLPAGFRGRDYLRRGITPLEKRYFGNACICSEEEKTNILTPNLFPEGWEPPWTVTAPVYRLSKNLDHTSRMQHLDLHTWLPEDILAKADRMSMAHSLELRSPFMDHVLVEFAATIPPCYKIRRGLGKYVLRRVASRYLPSRVSFRPKLGFPVPIASWIRSSFMPSLRELYHSETAYTYLNPEALDLLLRAHCRGSANHARKLWTAAIFLLWHRLFFETRPDTANRIAPVPVLIASDRTGPANTIRGCSPKATQ